jgi:hypothetical protein
VGEPAGPEAVYWITEQKNRQTPVAAAEVEHFQRAAAVWQAERGVPEAVLWLYSRSGFEDAARERLQGAGILGSELADLQVLADQLGFLGL